MTETTDRDYYTVPEAARHLAVSEATIWRWVKARRLPAYRVGPRRIRIRKRDLEAIVRPAEAPVMGETARGEGETPDLWAGYDPERVRAALKRSFGVLRGIDREALLAEIHAARGQDSSGRPA